VFDPSRPPAALLFLNPRRSGLPQSQRGMGLCSDRNQMGDSGTEPPSGTAKPQSNGDRPGLVVIGGETRLRRTCARVDLWLRAPSCNGRNIHTSHVMIRHGVQYMSADDQ
jgi:hypothetical protein